MKKTDNAWRNKIARSRAKKAARRTQRKTKRLRRSVLFPYRSFILTDLSGVTFEATHLAARKRQSLRVPVPKAFSLFDAPAAALKTVINLAKGAREMRMSSINFDHSKVQSIDLGSESLLALSASEALKELRSHRKSLPSVSGAYPKDSQIKRLIRAVGVVRRLGVHHEYLPPAEAQPIRIFRAQTKYGTNVTSLQLSRKKEEAVRGFVEHVDRCLRDHGHRLSPLAKSKLSEYTGEIISNAEDHAGTGQWTVLGYLDNTQEGAECEIVIYSFGKSFAQTFLDLPEDSFAYQQVLPYLEAHRTWFGIGWRREDLLTLIALQGHISSKNTSQHDDRGQGTVDLIEFFQRVHQELKVPGKSAKMAIISGGTHVLFDGSYQMTRGADGRKILAFNAENDLARRPDFRYVTNLGDSAFPGTIIAIRFPLPSGGTPWMQPS